jgi:hypothetical protein
MNVTSWLNWGIRESMKGGVPESVHTQPRIPEEWETGLEPLPTARHRQAGATLQFGDRRGK